MYCSARYFNCLGWAVPSLIQSPVLGAKYRARGKGFASFRILLCAVAAFVTLPTLAYAAAESEALIKEAIELRRAGQDAAAIPKLQRAYEMESTPRGAAQLGLCLQAVGRWSEADYFLARALAAPRDPWVKKNRDTLKDSLEAVKAHVGRVEVIGDPDGAQVFVNGRQVGTFPLPDAIPVNEGLVKVELRAAGHEAAFKDLTISGGSYQRVVLRLSKTPQAVDSAKPLPSVAEVPADDPSLAITAAAPEDGPTPLLKRPWFWIGAGTVVAAGILTAIVLSSGGTTTSPQPNLEGELR